MNEVDRVFGGRTGIGKNAYNRPLLTHICADAMVYDSSRPMDSRHRLCPRDRYMVSICGHVSKKWVLRGVDAVEVPHLGQAHAAR